MGYYPTNSSGKAGIFFHEAWRNSGIVGESGLGKTQTALSILRLLKKQERIASGEILFQGKNLAKLPLKEMEKISGKEISMIFQEPMTSLNPVLTIGTQIEEGMKLHTQMTARERSRKPWKS